MPFKIITACTKPTMYNIHSCHSMLGLNNKSKVVPSLSSQWSLDLTKEQWEKKMFLSLDRPNKYVPTCRKP